MGPGRPSASEGFGRFRCYGSLRVKLFRGWGLRFLGYGV